MRWRWLAGLALVACQGLYNKVPDGGSSSGGGGGTLASGGGLGAAGGGFSSGGGSAGLGGGSAAGGGSTAVGGGGDTTSSDYTVLDAGSFTVVRYPLINEPNGFQAVDGLSANDVYAAGNSGEVFHFTNGAWLLAHQTSPGAQLYAVRELPSGAVIAAGYHVVATCSAACESSGSWNDQVPIDTDANIWGLCNRGNDVWAVASITGGGSRVYSFDAGFQRFATVPTVAELFGCAVLPDGSLLAVGEAPVHIALDGGVTIEAFPTVLDALPIVYSVVIDQQGVAWGGGFWRRLLRREPSGTWTRLFSDEATQVDNGPWNGLVQLPSGTLLAAGRFGDVGPIGLFDGGLQVLGVPPAVEFFGVWAADENTWFLAGAEMSQMGVYDGVLYRVTR